jgi:hypothetical protein
VTPRWRRERKDQPTLVFGPESTSIIVTEVSTASKGHTAGLSRGHHHKLLPRHLEEIVHHIKSSMKDGEKEERGSQLGGFTPIFSPALSHSIITSRDLPKNPVTPNVAVPSVDIARARTRAQAASGKGSHHGRQVRRYSFFIVPNDTFR